MTMDIPLWVILYMESVFTARLHPIVAIPTVALFLFLAIVAIRDTFTTKKGN